MTGRRNPARALFVWVVRGYQVFISPGLPGRCKYHPSCSQYAIDAVKEYGLLRGFVLASWRLLRCNPLSYGGYDPVHRQTLFAPRLREDAGSNCGDGHCSLPADRGLSNGRTGAVKGGA